MPSWQLLEPHVALVPPPRAHGRQILGRVFDALPRLRWQSASSGVVDVRAQEVSLCHVTWAASIVMQ